MCFQISRPSQTLILPAGNTMLWDSVFGSPSQNLALHLHYLYYHSSSTTVTRHFSMWSRPPLSSSLSSIYGCSSETRHSQKHVLSSITYSLCLCEIFVINFAKRRRTLSGLEILKNVTGCDVGRNGDQEFQNRNHKLENSNLKGIFKMLYLERHHKSSFTISPIYGCRNKFRYFSWAKLV